jgi:dGTPase
MTQSMRWDLLLSRDRLRVAPKPFDVLGPRTPFESDIDRITFAPSFRRLAKKTQVHPLAPNDHVHNRLTHSLEVARVGAALGSGVAKKLRSEMPANIEATDVASIVQAACLAHDIGNPPFGHAGEEAIADWFRREGSILLGNSALDEAHRNDLARYEGNAQGFRVITQTEGDLFRGGINLTAATLGTFLKYPWTSEGNKKFSVYLSELALLDEVARRTGLLRNESKKGWCRHPLAYLVEAADDICYAIIDIEDAVELGIVSYADARELLERQFARQFGTMFSALKQARRPDDFSLARLRGIIFDWLVSVAIDTFVTNHELIMSGKLPGDLFSTLEEGSPARELVEGAKRLARGRIFTDRKKVEIELGCNQTLSALLTEFCAAAIKAASHLANLKHSKLDWKSELVLRMLKDHSPLEYAAPSDGSWKWDDYNCLRRAMDFVGGMTDNYAVYVAAQIRGVAMTGIQRP